MEMTPKHAILTVKKAAKKDDGPYRVVLQNDLGKDDAEVRAKIKGMLVVSELFVFHEGLFWRIQNEIVIKSHLLFRCNSYLTTCSNIDTDNKLATSYFTKLLLSCLQNTLSLKNRLFLKNKKRVRN